MSRAADEPPRSPPKMVKHPMYDHLRRGEWAEFNAAKAKGDTVDLRGADLRGVDFKNIDITGLDFADAYLRQADLRGVDFRGISMEGASIHGARISGTFFPYEFTAEEINLSLLQGTRLRCKSKS